MGEEETEEQETYSLIFKSLRHPIRRRILRMLADRPLAFSEILEALSVESGHLSYHLENLGELVTRTSDGFYKLSSIGIAATKLMSGVEEQTVPIIPRSRKRTLLKVVTALSIMLFIFALIPASLYFYNYTIIGSSSWSEHTELIPRNQTFSYNVTVVYGDPPYESGSRRGYYYEREPAPIKTTTFWEEDYVLFTLQLSGRGSVRWKVYDSHNNLIKNGASFSDAESGSDWYPWSFPVDGSGTWRFEAECLPLYGSGDDSMPGNATLIAGLKRERYEKPHYYYGVAGLLIAAICPALMLVSWILNKGKLRLN